MASFALVLFFSVTGLTLNHPDWFPGHQKTTERIGVADKSMLRTASRNGADKLGLVEMFRARDHVRGSVTDFRVDDAQISISFRAPGYTADIFLDRDTGKYNLTEVQNGFVAVMNDLHKGRDAGKAWSLIIDLSAVLLVVVSLTGLVLIWFIHKRRVTALFIAALAAACSIAIWRIFAS